jgi:hypothetical protein
VPEGVARPDDGAGVEEGGGGLPVAVVRRPVERRGGVLVARAHVGARGEESAGTRKVAEGGGDVERRGAVAGRGARVRARGEEEIHDRPVVGLGPPGRPADSGVELESTGRTRRRGHVRGPALGEVERLVSAVGPVAEDRAVPYQQAGHGGMPRHRGYQEWRQPVGLAGAEVGPGVEEHRGGRRVPHPGGEMERRAGVREPRFPVGPRCQQAGHRVGLASLGRREEGREPRAVPDVSRRAPLQQEIDQRQLTAGGGARKRRPSRVVRASDRRAGREEEASRGQVLRPCP